MKGKSSTQNAEIERFYQLINSDSTLLSGSEFEHFHQQFTANLQNATEIERVPTQKRSWATQHLR